MTKTRSELVNRALQKLKVVGAGQTASAEDSQFVNDELEPVMSDLAVRNIFVWGDPDEIDDAAFVHLADILANSVAGDFGQAQDETVRLYAEKRLRELNLYSLSGQRQTSEYY